MKKLQSIIPDSTVRADPGFERQLTCSTLCLWIDAIHAKIFDHLTIEVPRVRYCRIDDRQPRYTTLRTGEFYTFHEIALIDCADCLLHVFEGVLNKSQNFGFASY